MKALTEIFLSRAEYAAKDSRSPNHRERHRGIEETRKLAAEKLAAAKAKIEEAHGTLQEEHDKEIAQAIASAEAAKDACEAAIVAKFAEVDRILASFPRAPRDAAEALKAPLREIVEAVGEELGENFAEIRLAASFCIAADRVDVCGAIDFPKSIAINGDPPLEAASRLVKAVRTGAGPAGIQRAILELEESVERAIRNLDAAGDLERGKVLLAHVGHGSLHLALAAHDRKNPWTPPPMTEADHRNMARSSKVVT